MRGSNQSKDLGNGVCPPAALGLLRPALEFGRTRFPAYSIGKVMMVKTPDRSLSLKPMKLHAPAGKTLPPSLGLDEPQRNHSKRGRPEAFQNTPEQTTKASLNKTQYSSGGLGRVANPRPWEYLIIDTRRTGRGPAMASGPWSPSVQIEGKTRPIP